MVSPYRPGVRAWMGWSILVSGSDAMAFLLTDLVQSPAYQYPRDIAPNWVWGALSVYVTAAFVLAFATTRGNDWLLRSGLLVQSVLHAVFGLSILGLTLNGTSSAITGATKWWAFVVVPLFLLSRPFRGTLDGLDD